MPFPGVLHYGRFYLTALSFLIADQATKLWIMANVAEGTYWFHSALPPIEVIPGFFYIVHIYNPGAAWGIFSGYGFILALLGIVALGFIYCMRREFGLEKPLMQYAFGMLTGGIIGNMIDRFRYDHVVDFLDFHFGNYRYPAFNIADCGITVGVAIYLIASLAARRT